MNKIICYINNNYIDIKKNNNINHIELDSIKNDDIINYNKFIKDIKKYNIFSNIIAYQVDIYLNHKILEKDIYYYKLIFEDLNCYKVNIYDTSKLLISPTLIDNNEYYILFYKNNYIKLLPKYLSHFLEINKIKELKIISNNTLINNSKTKCYYYNNINNYFLKLDT